MAVGLERIGGVMIYDVTNPKDSFDFSTVKTDDKEAYEVYELDRLHVSSYSIDGAGEESESPLPPSAEIDLIINIQTGETTTFGDDFLI